MLDDADAGLRPRAQPEFGLIWRGLVFAIGAAAAAVGAWRAIGGPLLVKPAAPALVVVAVLSAWAAAIHLSGGEEFDDMPWV